ncbi:Protein LYK5 [Senna tora]|uniref:Protein LYK5 n=1 Tax=Senna tora TaxID=362788 RepID=A0A834SN20_9FABA|nr:Protein LYK5 [Senna tora]
MHFTTRPFDYHHIRPKDQAALIKPIRRFSQFLELKNPILIQAIRNIRHQFRLHLLRPPFPFHLPSSIEAPLPLLFILSHPHSILEQNLSVNPNPTDQHQQQPNDPQPYRQSPHRPRPIIGVSRRRSGRRRSGRRRRGIRLVQHRQSRHGNENRVEFAEIRAIRVGYSLRCRSEHRSDRGYVIRRLNDIGDHVVHAVSTLRLVRALAEHREDDVDADRQIRRDESRVHDFDGLIGREVLELVGGD